MTYLLLSGFTDDGCLLPSLPPSFVRFYGLNKSKGKFLPGSEWAEPADKSLSHNGITFSMKHECIFSPVYYNWITSVVGHIFLTD
jgi:hypothetical protein